MSAVPDYEYYSKTFKGALAEDVFNSLVNDAFYAVSALTFTRSENPPASMTDRVLRCICEIVDIKHSYSLAQELLPRGIGSINNDDLIVSNSVKNSSTQTETTEQSDYEAVCRKYLLMPANLMYAGVF